MPAVPPTIPLQFIGGLIGLPAQRFRGSEFERKILAEAHKRPKLPRTENRHWSGIGY